MNSNEKARKIIGVTKKVNDIVTALLLVVSGVLFITSCYSIYKSGHSPFTRESIAEAFSKIAVPVYFTLASVIVGAVLYVLSHLIFDVDAEKIVGKRTPKLVMKSLYSKVDFDTVAPEIKALVNKQEMLRKILFGINVAICILSGILPLIYLLNPNNFPAIVGEYNSEIGRGMIVYTVSLLPAFIYEIAYVIVTDISIAKETQILKDAIKTSATVKAEKEAEVRGVLAKTSDFFAKNEKQITLGVRIALVGSALVFISVGIVNGGIDDVLQKAIKICTECIGLG